MKVSFFSILAILSVTATAATSGYHVPSTGHEVKRQQATRPPVGSPAMADANGNVVPYDRAGVVSNKVKREAMVKAKRHAMAVKKRSEKSKSRKRTVASTKTANKRTAGKKAVKATKRTPTGGAKKGAQSKKRGVGRR